MHVHEAILSAPVLAGGAVLAAGGIALGLRKLDYDRVPQVGVLSATLFVASFVHVPVGPASLHLALSGLCGLLLGWASFPAIFVALLLQAPLGHGGFTTLGVNTLIMAVPAVACHYLFGAAVRGTRGAVATIAAGACGATAVLLGGILMATSLVSTSRGFWGAAIVAAGAHVPVMVVEAAVTASIVGFLRRVRPKILEALHASR